MIELGHAMSRSEIAWLNGCCILARRDVLQQLSGFDEGFFLYQAETDLCLRARRLGYSLGWVSDVTVHHLHRQSQRDISEYEYSRRLFEGSAVFWRKHYSAGDVVQMAQFQARWSSALLALAVPFERLLPLQLRRDRLRARRDVCREVAASSESAEGKMGTRRGIISRQSRLALEWVRQGRFPLDDY
jgi:GT2 family glycosyltransferase